MKKVLQARRASRGRQADQDTRDPGVFPVNPDCLDLQDSRESLVWRGLWVGLEFEDVTAPKERPVWKDSQDSLESKDSGALRGSEEKRERPWSSRMPRFLKVLKALQDSREIRAQMVLRELQVFRDLQDPRESQAQLDFQDLQEKRVRRGSVRSSRGLRDRRGRGVLREAQDRRVLNFTPRAPRN